MVAKNALGSVFQKWTLNIQTHCQRYWVLLDQTTNCSTVFLPTSLGQANGAHRMSDTASYRLSGSCVMVTRENDFFLQLRSLSFRKLVLRVCGESPYFKMGKQGGSAS